MASAASLRFPALRIQTRTKYLLSTVGDQYHVALLVQSVIAVHVLPSLSHHLY